MMLSYFMELVVDHIDRINNVPSIEEIKVTKVTIDYTKTMEQAIADTNYNVDTSLIHTDNFPISQEMAGKKVEVFLTLFNFFYTISLEDVIFKMDKAGFREATLMELLAMGSSFPESQRQFPIIALGSVYGNEVYGNGKLDKLVPCLHTRGSNSSLFLSPLYSQWHSNHRFLAVRK